MARSQPELGQPYYVHHVTPGLATRGPTSYGKQGPLFRLKDIRIYSAAEARLSEQGFEHERCKSLNGLNPALSLDCHSAYTSEGFRLTPPHKLGDALLWSSPDRGGLDPHSRGISV